MVEQVAGVTVRKVQQRLIGAGGSLRWFRTLTAEGVFFTSQPGPGGFYHFPAVVLDQLAAALSLKGRSPAIVRHELWWKCRLPLADWTRWRDDRVKELETFAGELEAIRLLVKESDLEAVRISTRWLDDAECQREGRQRRSVIDRRTLRSQDDRVEAIRHVLSPWLEVTVPDLDEPTESGTLGRDVLSKGMGVSLESGLAEAYDQAPARIFNPRALVDTMRRLEEPVATAIRDHLIGVALPAVRKELRPAMRPKLDGSAVLGRVVAAVAVLAESELPGPRA